MKIFAKNAAKALLPGRFVGAYRNFRQQRFAETRRRFLNGLAPCLSTDSPTVLFWHEDGMSLYLPRDAFIALGLRARGFKTLFVLCDGQQLSCSIRVSKDPQNIDAWCGECAGCFNAARDILDNFGLEWIPFSSCSSSTEFAEANGFAAEVRAENLEELEYQTVSIGKNICSNLARLYGHKDVAEMDPRIVRETIATACRAVTASAGLFETIRPWKIFCHHAVYAGVGPARRFYAEKGVNWFSPLGYYGVGSYAWKEFKRVDETAADVFYPESAAIIDAQNADDIAPKVEALFNQRYFGGNERPLAENIADHLPDVQKLLGQYNIPADKKRVGIFLQCTWDQSHDGHDTVFAGTPEYLEHTIEQIITIPEVTWLVKIHPADKRYDYYEDASAYIARRFPNLPEWVKIIPAEADMNPMAFLSQCDAAVSYFGTVGVEAACFGIPVVTTATGYFYAGKGFTIDPETVDEYDAILQKAASLPAMTEEQIRQARKHAYWYFVSMLIPDEISSMTPSCEADLRALYEKSLPGESFWNDMVFEGLEKGTLVYQPPEMPVAIIQKVWSNSDKLRFAAPADEQPS